MRGATSSVGDHDLRLVALEGNLDREFLSDHVSIVSVGNSNEISDLGHPILVRRPAQGHQIHDHEGFDHIVVVIAGHERRTQRRFILDVGEVAAVSDELHQPVGVLQHLQLRARQHDLVTGTGRQRDGQAAGP
jgi:hypothetical protein